MKIEVCGLISSNPTVCAILYQLNYEEIGTVMSKSGNIHK